MPEMEMASPAAEAELNMLLLQPDSNVLTAVWVPRNTVLKILEE